MREHWWPPGRRRVGAGEELPAGEAPAGGARVSGFDMTSDTPNGPRRRPDRGVAFSVR